MIFYEDIYTYVPSTNHPILWGKKKVTNFSTWKENIIDSSENKENLDMNMDRRNRKTSTFKKLVRQSGSTLDSSEFTHTTVAGKFESMTVAYPWNKCLITYIEDGDGFSL